ncbi:hypothetical protein Q5P01_000993 [Channa striata]|uniref:Uncharacterized protein n=1 Tax=Channa striata TaxID=64152 RepID=A0AA88IWE7_CHASR|nr:hypothetical protein Q5P01_000993 [Channa striata]
MLTTKTKAPRPVTAGLRVMPDLWDEGLSSVLAGPRGEGATAGTRGDGRSARGVRNGLDEGTRGSTQTGSVGGFLQVPSGGLALDEVRSARKLVAIRREAFRLLCSCALIQRGQGVRPPSRLRPARDARTEDASSPERETSASGPPRSPEAAGGTRGLRQVCRGALTPLVVSRVDSISRGLRAIDSTDRRRRRGSDLSALRFRQTRDPPPAQPTARRTLAVSQIDELLLGGICTSLCAGWWPSRRSVSTGSYCLNHRRATPSAKKEESASCTARTARAACGGGREGDGTMESLRVKREVDAKAKETEGEEDPDPGGGRAEKI